MLFKSATQQCQIKLPQLISKYFTVMNLRANTKV
jgi:hypothetical protein